ncbi:MAG: hypothetical protein AB8B61_09985 [Cyclobacteriaceae bacterium]
MNPLINVNRRKLNSEYLILKTYGETAKKNKIDKVFKKAAKEIEGLNAIAVVELETGLPHGSLISDDSFDFEAACAYYAEVLKGKIKALEAMNIPGEKVEESISKLSTQIHLLRPTSDHRFFIYLSANSAHTNLGVASNTIKNASIEISSILG